MTSSIRLRTLAEGFNSSDRMPLVFLGHGSPMNAIEDTEFSRAWSQLGRDLPRPQAILVVSAHWVSVQTTLVDVSAHPKTIHDFRGFPPELFDQQYPAPGAPDLAQDVVSLLASHDGEENTQWGLDHGAWSVLKHLYPDADVPVFQVSIDMTRDLPYQLEVGKNLSRLRNKGVLILGSGNVVHNLRAAQHGRNAYDFALEFDARFSDLLTARDFDWLSSRNSWGPILNEAHPTVDHYLPALTIAGASDDRDELTFMTDKIDLASISMRSFVFHSS